MERAERANDPIYDFLRDRDQHEIPEDFIDRFDQAALAEVILGLEEPFEFNIVGNSDFNFSLDRVKSAQPPDRWQRILSNLQIVASFGEVPPEYDFETCILINGGFAIQLQKDVIVLELNRGSSQSGIDLSAISSDLAEVLRNADDVYCAHLLHHEKLGLEVRRKSLPEPFHPVGQTLLYVGDRELLHGLPILGKWERWGKTSPRKAWPTIGFTRYDYLVFRIFRDTVCAYQVYGPPADLSIVLEYCGSKRFSYDTDQSEAAEGIHFRFSFDSWSKDSLEEYLNEWVTPELAADFRTAMLSAENPRSFRNRLEKTTNMFCPPLFTEDYSQHVAFGADASSPWVAAAYERDCESSWAYCFLDPMPISTLRGYIQAALSAKAVGAVVWDQCEHRFLPFDAPGLDYHSMQQAGFGIPINRLEEAHALALSICRTAHAELQLVVPHVGLHQKYSANGRLGKGNARWFGLSGRQWRRKL